MAEEAPGLHTKAGLLTGIEKLFEWVRVEGAHDHNLALAESKYEIRVHWDALFPYERVHLFDLVMEAFCTSRIHPGFPWETVSRSTTHIPQSLPSPHADNPHPPSSALRTCGSSSATRLRSSPTSGACVCVRRLLTAEPSEHRADAAIWPVNAGHVSWMQIARHSW